VEIETFLKKTYSAHLVI